MFAFVILILVFTPILIVFLNRKQKFSGKQKYSYPEPPGNLLFGHILDVASTRNLINIASKWTEEYGSIVQLKFGPLFAPLKTCILITDYKFLEFVLSSNKLLTKSENYEFFKPWLGDGLFVTDSHIWKRHRKILTPAFHFDILKQFVSVFESVGNVLIEKLGEKADSPSLDLHHYVSLCSLDIISETAMGTKINAQEGETLEYIESVKGILTIVLSRITQPFKVYNWTFMLTKDYFTQRKLIKIAHKLTLDVINSREKKRKENNQYGKKMAFLDLLLKYSQGGKLLSFNEIREEVDTFMFAGHDTTSAGICYTLYSLADNPEIQKKVLEEQKELFNNEKNPEITYQDLQNMKYLELVIKESLRYYPVVPMIGRYTTEDIEYDGQIIPKNTNIGIFIYGILRSPKFFPEPEKFDPDRFNNLDNSQPFAYIPFSAGPRNCIGQKFAMLEMKSVVSKVIRNFELVPATPKHKLEFAAEVVLHSVTGIKVGLKKRP